LRWPEPDDIFPNAETELAAREMAIEDGYDASLVLLLTGGGGGRGRGGGKMDDTYSDSSDSNFGESSNSDHSDKDSESGSDNDSGDSDSDTSTSSNSDSDPGSECSNSNGGSLKIDISATELNGLRSDAGLASMSSRTFANDTLLTPRSRASFKPTRASAVNKDPMRNINRSVCRFDEDEDPPEYVDGLVLMYSKKDDEFEVLFEDDVKMKYNWTELAMALALYQAMELKRRRRRAEGGGEGEGEEEGGGGGGGLSITNPDTLLDNIGDFDEGNIVVGKRRRANVDYRKLNDDMFGDLSPGKAAKMLGEDSADKGFGDYVPSAVKKKRGRGGRMAARSSRKKGERGGKEEEGTRRGKKKKREESEEEEEESEEESEEEDNEMSADEVEV